MIGVDLDGIEARTAAKLTTLCALRGVKSEVTWDGAQYLADGEPCGPSVHGVMAWLENQVAAKAVSS